MTLSRNSANSAVGALESVEALDPAALKLADAVRNVVPVGAPRDALSGTWLGHALHPLLTDVVIGSFVSATVLDLLGGDDTGRASERLIEVGLVTSAPTVASGLTDWALTVLGDRRTRPVGLAHATANLTASTLYAASLVARRRGARGRGKLLGVAGGAVLSVGGLLGGHLSFTRGVGVNETAFDEGPADWTAVDARELEDGKPTARWRATHLFCCSSTAVTCTRCTTAVRTAAVRSAAARSRASPSPVHATARASAFATARSNAARRQRRNPSSRPVTATAGSR